MADFDNEKTAAATAEMPSFHGLIDDLIGIVSARQSSKNKLYPAIMPNDPSAAADWFIKLFAGQKRNEAVKEQTTKNGKVFMVWPYADRIRYLAGKFVNSTDDLQNLIVAARHDRIEWRGDDLEHFSIIIEEAEEMQKVGLTQYRKDCRPRIQAFKQKIADRNKPQTESDIEANRQAAIEYTEAHP